VIREGEKQMSAGWKACVLRSAVGFLCAKVQGVYLMPWEGDR